MHKLYQKANISKEIVKPIKNRIISISLLRRPIQEGLSSWTATGQVLDSWTATGHVQIQTFHQISHVMGLEMTFWIKLHMMILHGFASRNSKNTLNQQKRTSLSRKRDWTVKYPKNPF